MPTKGVRGEELAELLLEMSDELEGKFRREFLRQIELLSGSKVLKQLLEDIETGAYESGDPIDVRLNRISIDTSALDEIMRNAIARSARITKDVVGLQGAFNVTNPEVINAARNLSVQLSTNLNTTARQTIRDIIQDAVEGNITRVEAANRIKRLVGLIPQHAQAVDKYLNRMLADGVKKSLAKQRADKYAERLLRYRANTIARTEIARSVGTGQTEYWKQMRSEGFLPPEARRVWITASDEKVCAICGPMNGVVADIDGFFDTSAGPSEYPQASHPNCRCTAGITMVKPKKRSPIKKEDELTLALWQLAKANPYKDAQGKFTTKAKAVAPKGKKPNLKRSGSKTKPAGDVFKRALKQVESLSYDDAIGIQDYSVMGFREINASLRKSNGKKIIRKTERMDRSFALGSTTLDQDVVVYRGAPLSVPAINKMLGERTIVVGKYGDIEVGKPKRTNFTDHGFASTTIDQERARRHSSEPTGGAAQGGKKPVNVLFKITVKKGSRVLAGTFRGGQEKELVLNRGTKYKVVSVSGSAVMRADGIGSIGTIVVEVEAVSP